MSGNGHQEPVKGVGQKPPLRLHIDVRTWRLTMSVGYRMEARTILGG